MQFQPSQYSDGAYGADEDYGGSLWTGANYTYYRALGYSAEEAAIKVFEYQEGRPATASEKVNIAAGWSGEDAQLPVDVIEQVMQEESAKSPAPSAGPSPSGAGGPPPSQDPKVPLTKQPWFWPTVIIGSSVAVGAAIMFWPKGKPLPLIGR
jgi:hypothetical protein